MTPQHLERGDDAVAGRRVLADDHVAALLAAEAGARRPHPLEDVLVADRRAHDPAAGRLDRRLEPAVREDRRRRGPPRRARRARAGRARGCRGAGRRRRRRPAASTASSRSASPSRAKPMSAPRSTTAAASDAGAVAPQPTLMLTPSGALWIDLDGAPRSPRGSRARRRRRSRWRSRGRCAGRRRRTRRGEPEAVLAIAVEQRPGVDDDRPSPALPARPARRPAR